ncbi:MAG: hypothetical protein ABSH08_21910 [Tepidisphaeraceae bacterium]|jgi:aspartyl/asparaginyl beta-hydroxylase (cupin superfamily)
MANDEVLAAMRRQLDCYQRLGKLTKTQHEYVQNSRNEDLLALLGQRQRLLEEMAQLEQIITPAKRNWKQFTAGLPDDQRTEAESLVGETRRLLEEIAAADRDDTLVLHQRKLNAGRGINQATAARKFNRAYAAAAYGQARAGLDLHR